MTRVTRIAGYAIAMLVAILLVDYSVAAYRAPRNDKLVKDLQQQAKTDAAFSPKEAAEEKRITAARLARKKRDGVVAWLLIAAAAVFVFSSGELVGRRVEIAPVPVRDRGKPLARALKPPSPLLKGPNRASLRYRIIDACIGCTVCAQVCPKGAILSRPYEKHVVDESLCKPCDMCRRVCQEDAVELS